MKTRQTDPTRRQLLAAMLAAPAALAAGCAGEDPGLEDRGVGERSDALATLQQLCDQFYDLANTLTISITMPPDQWTALRTAVPVGGNCNFDTLGDRYSWFTATSVEIAGSLCGTQTFSNVGIKKKSFCGSFSTTVPCLKLDLAKYDATNEPVAEQFIGTRYITLNNSIQDASFVRQLLGYLLFKLAGLPHSRCNFTKVIVNGTQVGPIYVNIEPVRQRYIERHFDNNLSGNLYELEVDDLVAARIPYIDVESLSAVQNKADLTFAAQHIAANGVAGMAQIVDMPSFIKLYAMEFLLKHRDGYTVGRNNTYLYNDVAAVASPGVNDIHFKLIPWGLDQILQPGSTFHASAAGSLLGGLVRNDPVRLGELKAQVRAYQQTVFDRSVQSSVITPYIDQMQAILVAAGVPNVFAQIAIVREQLKLANSAAYLFGGFPAAAVNLIDVSTGHGLRASDTATIPANAPNPTNWEVVHGPATDASLDRWYVTPPLIKSWGTKRPLTSTLVLSGANHHLLATTTNPVGKADGFAIELLNSPSAFNLSGLFRLRSLKTNEYLCYGTDDLVPAALPDKAVLPRVYLAPLAQASTLYGY